METDEFKVLLVYPNMQMVNLLPSNISILTACLKETGVTVDLFDTTLYKIEEESVDDKRAEYLQTRPVDYARYGIRYKQTDMYDDFYRKAQSFRPNLIAVTLVEDTFSLAVQLLKRVSDLNIPTIAGGVQVVLAPDMILKEKEIDMICYGEGEEALPELCQRMADGKPYTNIKNIWVKSGKRVIKNPMRPLVNLNKIPYNDFSLFEEVRFYRPMQGKIFKMVPIEIDRGCPYDCTFCSAPSLRQIYQQETGCKYYRIKSIPRIIKELDHQIKTYNAEYLYFNSETFLVMNDNSFQHFADEYIHHIHLPFWCQSRIETITERKIALLEQMGCNRLSVGIEHGNETFRNTVLKKRFTNQDVLNAFDILRRHKIPITTNNMIGFPGETREMVFDTINLNRQLTVDSINVFIFKPYHGTHLRKTALKNGYLIGNNPVHSILESTLDMPQLSKTELVGLLRTFPLYVRCPEEAFPEIKVAESDDRTFDRLALKFKERYWT